MICKSCGHLLSDNDKFCPECGARVVVDASQTASGRPGAQGGQDAAGRTEGNPAPSASQGKERSRRHFQFEEIDWNLDGYPTEQKKETDEVDFNWESVIDQHAKNAHKDAPEETEALGKIRPETPEKPPVTDPVEVLSAEPAQPADEQGQGAQSIEEVIFGTRDRDGNISETQRFDNPADLSGTTRMEKFYTYNKKNEEFQALLDKEYNRLKDQLDVDYREPEEQEEVAAEKVVQNPVFEAPSFGGVGDVTEDPTRVFDAALFETAPAFSAPAFGAASAFGAVSAEEETKAEPAPVPPTFEMPTFETAEPVEEVATPEEEPVAPIETPTEEVSLAGTPAFDLPETETETEAVSEAGTPAFDLPELEKTEEVAAEAIPTVEEVPTEAPVAGAPAFDLPEVTEDQEPMAPAFEIPQTEEPAAEPAFVMPEMPTFEPVAPVTESIEEPVAPAFEMPQAEEPVAPAFEMPEMPTFEPAAPVTEPQEPKTEESMVEIPSFMRTETPAFEAPRTEVEQAASAFSFPTFEPAASADQSVEEPATVPQEPIVSEQPAPEVVGFAAPQTPEGYFVETPQQEIPTPEVAGFEVPAFEATQQEAPAETAAPASPFGAPAETAAPASPFEAPAETAAPASPFGAPAERAAPASPFGAPAETAAPASPFGAPAETAAPASPFGAPAETAAPASPFGAPASPFGAPADPFAVTQTEGFVPQQEAPQAEQPATEPGMEPFRPTKTEDNAAEIEKMIREDTAGGIPTDDNKITFQDVFKDELEAEAKAKARKPKKYLGLKIFAIILCVLIVLEIVVICIKYLAPESAASIQLQNMFNGVYNGLSSIFGG